MKDLKILFSVIILLFINVAFAGPDLEVVRKRVTDDLMKQSVSDEEVRDLVKTLNTDGSWPGIDYSDVSRTGFQHSRHLGNLVELCLAYRKNGSALKGDPGLKKAFGSALEFWLKNDFICDNWWWNQIGTPDQLIDYYLDGICQTMVYGKYPDPGAENRSISREGNLEAMSARTPEKLLNSSSYREADTILHLTGPGEQALSRLNFPGMNLQEKVLQ